MGKTQDDDFSKFFYPCMSLFCFFWITLYISSLNLVLNAIRIAQSNPFWRIHLFNWLGRIVFQVSSQTCIVYLWYGKQSPIPFPTPLLLKRKILETFFLIWILLWIKASIKLYFKVTHTACFMQKLPAFDWQLLTLNISCGFSMSQGLKVIKDVGKKLIFYAFKMNMLIKYFFLFMIQYPMHSSWL